MLQCPENKEKKMQKRDLRQGPAWKTGGTKALLQFLHCDYTVG
jgi:hypothetical protein